MSKEQQLEGEYRQLHSRLRTNAESIALYGGERREEFHIQQKFGALIRHMRVVHHNHWWFGMIQDFLVKYLGATVAVILIIEPFFAGHLKPDTSTLGRATMLSNLRYHTSVIISLFKSLGTLSISSRRLSRLSGYADRIHELIVISRELSCHDKSSLQRNGARNYFSEANYVEFSGVKVVTPTGNVLVKDLTLKVEPGSNLLITGPNGSGKSSLFRVLGGLWPMESGHIVKPGVGSDLNKEIFYVPQRPYTAVGTLQDQLIYPLTADQEVEPLTHNAMVELLKNFWKKLLCSVHGHIEASCGSYRLTLSIYWIVIPLRKRLIGVRNFPWGSNKGWGWPDCFTISLSLQFLMSALVL
uniref:Peroxisomal membrane protein n=1 Tax=Rhizophora mucronata TaxID=61149 RepID=A0A2P2MUB3_RHIMU